MQISLIALMLMIFLYSDILKIDDNISGNWVGNYNKNKISIEFNDDNACVIRLINKKTNKIETISGNYNLDISKNPIPISIRNIKELNYSLYGIIKFVDKDSIQISTFSTKLKLSPISFDTTKIIKLERSQK